MGHFRNIGTSHLALYVFTEGKRDCFRFAVNEFGADQKAFQPDNSPYVVWHFYGKRALRIVQIRRNVVLHERHCNRLFIFERLRNFCLILYDNVVTRDRGSYNYV